MKPSEQATHRATLRIRLRVPAPVLYIFAVKPVTATETCGGQLLVASVELDRAKCLTSGEVANYVGGVSSSILATNTSSSTLATTDGRFAI